MMYVTFEDLFESFRYPAGESHVRLIAEATATLPGPLVIEANAKSFDDLGQIITADRLLRHNGVDATWFIPYFPFARHDRRIDRSDGLELTLALEMVSNLNIVIADPHSDMTAQLPHIPQISVVDVLRSRGAFDNNPIVVIPDAGASRKAHEWAGPDTVQALKHRDPHTGKLSGFGLQFTGNEPLDLGGRPCIIVDDICDGGGTFLGLAALLAEHNAGPLTLAVTHGLFTKGTEALRAAFDRIYTFCSTGCSTDSAIKSATDPTAEATAVERIPFNVLYEKGNLR